MQHCSLRAVCTSSCEHPVFRGDEISNDGTAIKEVSTVGGGLG
jgi:hypothetical protein